MNREEFYKKYCVLCGSQRCEGIDSEWFDGCKEEDKLDETELRSEVHLNGSCMNTYFIITNGDKEVENKLITFGKIEKITKKFNVYEIITSYNMEDIASVEGVIRITSDKDQAVLKYI